MTNKNRFFYLFNFIHVLTLILYLFFCYIFIPIVSLTVVKEKLLV